VDDGHALLDQLLRIDLAPGHTPGSITIALDTPQRRALFTGDILHHPVQVAIPEWNSAFCGDPVLARASRRRVLERCVDTNAILMPAHFGHPHCGHVHRKGEAFSLQPVEPDA
jgi:glyoxylase-like metal-dependent hydrolase (beta-lactamase superfamily II)